MENQSLDTPSEPVIACSLNAADLQDRQQAWFKVGRFITAAGLVPGGLSFDFARAGRVWESLAELVRLEAECCAWMSFAVTEEPQGIRLVVTGVGAVGERGVRESFGQLARG